MSGMGKRAPVSISILRVAVGILLALGPGLPSDLWANDRPIILSLGDDSYITWSEVESRTDAIVRRELGDARLAELSLVVLSNVRYDSLPEALRQAGYLHVALDLAGYRMGSLNELIRAKSTA